MTKTLQSIRAAAALLALTATAATAHAQRVSLATLSDQLGALELRLAEFEKRAAVDGDPGTQTGLTISNIQTKFEMRSIVITGSGFGVREGKERVLLVGPSEEETTSRPILTWTDSRIEVELDLRNASLEAPGSVYSIVVANETPIENGGPPVLQTDAAEFVVGAVGRSGPLGPDGPEGEVGLQGEAGPKGPGGPVGPEGAAGNQGRRGAEGIQGAAGPQGPSGQLLDYEWRESSSDCPSARSCSNTMGCAEGYVLVAGQCGAADNESLLIRYTGPDPSNSERWKCGVDNLNLIQARTYSYGAFCVEQP